MSIGVTEIAKNMRDKSVMRQEMISAMELVQNTLNKKYTDKLRQAISAHQAAALQKPSKEIQLLLAFKPFMPQNEAAIDQMVNALITAQTAKTIQAELAAALGTPDAPRQRKTVNAYENAANNMAAPLDQSVHDDGVYDVDQACMHRKNRPKLDGSGHLFAFLLLLRIMA